MHGLSAIKKTVTGVEGGVSKFVLFLSLFLPVHINFRYKLNSHKRLFIVTVNLFSSIALLIFFHLQFHPFFSLYKFNMNKLAFSLAVPSFVFTFNSRKSQQKLILNTKSTSKRRKLKYLFKSKLNQFLLSPLLASNCYTMYQKQHFCVELYSDIWKNIPYLPANID